MFSGQNSKNFKLFILLFIVVVCTFGYIILTNGVNHTIYTDIREGFDNEQEIDD